MAKEKMTDRELAALCRRSIDNAVTFESSELSKKRSRAMEYYNGEMADVPAQPNRSKVTARTISEIMGWIIPSMMRIFTASDRIAEYEPQTQEDTEYAKQATDYINFVFMRECDGYRILHDAIFEGFLYGNGIIKTWWDSTPKTETFTYTGLSEDQFTMLVADDDVDVLEHTLRPEVEPLHDVKIRKTMSRGCLRVKCIPPEEYLIRSEATDIDDTDFHCHRFLDTKENLKDQGYDAEIVDTMGGGEEIDFSDEKEARFEDVDSGFGTDERTDDQQEVEVFECYIKVDFDDDGHSEWRKVVMGGTTDKAQVLANDEWDEDHPFCDLVPMPRAHRWDGRSVYDECEDLQRINTVLIRQTLDNLYMTNNPQRVARDKNIKNPESLLDLDIGGVIWTTGSIQDAVRTETIPFVAANSFQMLEFMDQIAEKRTGVSKQSMALDPEALQNQTATASNNAMTAAYAKLELYARNIAEMGLRSLFRKMLRLTVKNQDRTRTIRLRDKFIEMDPRVWNTNMDCTVSVGLGSGTRERDLQVLAMVAQKQEQVVAVMGPNNPFVTPTQVVSTYQKMVESAGLKSPDQYFTQPDETAMAQFQEQQANKPDPEMAKVQAKAQADQATAQVNAQIDMQKMTMERDISMQKMQQEFELKRYQIDQELALKREQLAAEIQLKREIEMVNAYNNTRSTESAISSSVNMGGDPG